MEFRNLINLAQLFIKILVPQKVSGFSIPLQEKDNESKAGGIRFHCDRNSVPGRLYFGDKPV
jgi:hypothetical protein